jgi:hypothetical protein
MPTAPHIHRRTIENGQGVPKQDGKILFIFLYAIGIGCAISSLGKLIDNGGAIMLIPVGIIGIGIVWLMAKKIKKG